MGGENPFVILTKLFLKLKLQGNLIVTWSERWKIFCDLGTVGTDYEERFRWLLYEVIM